MFGNIPKNQKKGSIDKAEDLRHKTDQKFYVWLTGVSYLR